MATQARESENGKAPNPTLADGEALDRDEEGAGRTAERDIKDNPRFQAMTRASERRAKEHGLEPARTLDTEESEDKGNKLKLDDDAASKLTLHGDGAEEEGEKKPAEEEQKPKGDGVDDGTAGAALADDAIVELKINGETKKLKWADAKKHLQLGLASEDTLARAKERAAEIKAAADAELLAARAARSVTGGEQAQQPERKEPTDAEKAKAAFDASKAKVIEAREKWSQATQYGTDEEVKAALAALNAAEDARDEARDKLTEASRPAPEPRTDPLLEREQMESKRATDDYADKFKDDQKDKLFRAAMAINMRDEIAADLTKIGADENMLAKLTDAELGVHHFRARSRGLVRTLDQIFTAAGTKAREELKSRSQPAKPAADPVAERQNRKNESTPAPRVAAGRAPEAEEEKPKTGSDLVAEARRRRGKG